MMPDLMDFLLYCFYNSNFKAETWDQAFHGLSLQHGDLSSGIHAEDREDRAGKEPSFTPPSRIKELAVMANDFVSLGNQTGEGRF